MASIYLAPIIFRIIYSNFTAADIFLECRLSRKVYSWLLVSKEGEIFIKDVIARDLDLPHTKLEISTIQLSNLIQLYIETFGLYRPQLGRFFGFKTSQSTDDFPNDWYGPQWLFLSPKNATFSSSPNDGPVLVTGIYHSEDIYDFLIQNPLFNRILCQELKEKRKFDIVLSQLDCSKGKWAMIRQLMFYFRSFRGIENTPHTLQQIAFYYQNPIMQTLQKIAYQDSEIKTPNFLREKYLEYFKIFKYSMDELMKYTDWISLSNSIDQEKTREVQIQAEGKLSKFYQLKHEIEHEDLFLIDSINFDQGDNNTCPAKTIVVYAHMRDFSYAKLPDVVSILNKCLSAEQVLKYDQSGLVPKVLNKNSFLNKNLTPYIADILLFNTECQRRADVKVLAWLQFHRFQYPQLSQIEIKLPRRVAAKYVTVSFLNCENYLQDSGDTIHTQTNIDMKCVSFQGGRIQTVKLKI